MIAKAFFRLNTILIALCANISFERERRFELDL